MCILYNHNKHGSCQTLNFIYPIEEFIEIYPEYLSITNLKRLFSIGEDLYKSRFTIDYSNYVNKDEMRLLKIELLNFKKITSIEELKSYVQKLIKFLELLDDIRYNELIKFLYEFKMNMNRDTKNTQRTNTKRSENK